MRYVLDTSVLLTGRQYEGELYTTPGVRRELRRHGSSEETEAFLDLKVRLASPDPASLAAVDAEADRSGDAVRLSPTDRGLLAVALELGASIVTDDYSIQNVASRLGVPYERIEQRGITETVRWRYRCTGCRRFLEEWRPVCPVCGARVRTTRAVPPP